ncbi:MAG: 50S ribosomal protein L10 [Planctomycetia bacterium]|nr:50S ribosomal protein L10 [Planctomycetia bacterium]
MSKYVKDLVTNHVAAQLDGVQDALLVDMVGMTANETNQLRGELEEKGVSLMVVKNTLARRAFEKTSLGPLFTTIGGSSAMCWGCEDIVSLTKIVCGLAADKRYADKFVVKCGVMDKERLEADQVKAVSTWPSRTEQLGMLVGQILGPGANLAAAMLGPGSTIAGQLKTKAGDEADADSAE